MIWPPLYDWADPHSELMWDDKRLYRQYRIKLGCDVVSNLDSCIYVPFVETMTTQPPMMYIAVALVLPR
jgi:hypothetical protein